MGLSNCFFYQPKRFSFKSNQTMSKTPRFPDFLFEKKIKLGIDGDLTSYLYELELYLLLADV